MCDREDRVRDRTDSARDSDGKRGDPMPHQRESNGNGGDDEQSFVPEAGRHHRQHETRNPEAIALVVLAGQLLRGGAAEREDHGDVKRVFHADEHKGRQG
jgi:hypothetical protein